MLSTIVAWSRGPGWGPGPWLVFVWLALWGATVAAVVWWWRRRLTGRHARAVQAQAVLAEQFARGSITEQEYRDRLAVLEELGRSGP
ncbi:MAG: SHOCT domain-containing protein [Acidimicrobiales bacterium]